MNHCFRRFYAYALVAVVLTIGARAGFSQVDSDGDGFTDQEELYLGTSTNDASIYPGCITNSFGSATNLIYVAKNGSDGNPGTAGLPFLTIQKAMTTAQGKSVLSIGSTILVEPGVYRESITLMPSGGVLHAPVILQAATNGTAAISGGDAWTNGWALAAGSTNVYQHSWTNNWGLSSVPAGWPTLSNITRRTEIVIVNGNLYKQVESTGAMSNGTYFVDEPNQLLNVQHLAGVVESNAFYEVSQRRSLMEVNNYNTGAVMSNLAVLGMDFRCAASQVESGAVRMINCKNVLYENCSFEFNNWTALYIGATSNVTLRASVADNNGTKGFEQYQVSSTVYDGVQTCFNNWRGALGQFYGWALAGSKLLHIHRAVFRDYLSYGNAERGMWFDSDCGAMIFERCVFNANLISSGGFGLFIEANQGPIRLQDCVIARNGGDWGLLANCSENVTVSNCVVYANGTGTGGQFGSSVNTSPRTTPDFETGVIHTNQLRFWNITDSVFSGLATTQLEVHLVNNLTNFLTTLTSDKNFWYNSATSNMYKIVSTSYDLNGWRGLTGQDTHSSFLSLLVTNPATQDTYINLGAATNNYGSATNALCDTQSNGTGTLDVALLKFDLSSLTSKPRESELQLAVTSILNNRSAVFYAYRLTTAWDENATANQAKTGTGWSAGNFSAADYDPQPYGLGGTRTGAGLNTIVDITTLVQEWVSGTAPNYGVAIIAQPIWDQPVNDPGFPNWKQFTIATRESATQTQRPQITSISRGSTIGGCPTISLAPPTLPAGGVSIVYTPVAITASGSSATPFSYSTPDMLPTGMSLSSQGTLSGTPTIAGTTMFAVLATDTNSCIGSNIYTLVITGACPTITVSPSLLPTGIVTWVYNAAVTANNGASPYTYTKTAGTLPTGVALDSQGVLNGRATSAGSFTFTVQATDNNGCKGSNNCTVVISPTGTCPTITLAPSTLPAGTVNNAYGPQAITASGGNGLYSYTKTSGSLPSGVTLSSVGTLSGTPTAVGSFPFTVQATDTNSCIGSNSYTLVVSAGGGPVFLDFNTTAADFTNNFYSNGGAFAWNATIGVTNSGGVKSSTTDETAIYKSGGWNLSNNGASVTISSFIRSTNSGASVQNALGLSTTTNGQFKSTSTGSWLTFFISTQSGFSQAKLGYQYKAVGATSTNINLATFAMLSTNWYKWSVTFTTTNAASGLGTGNVTLENYGPKGTNLVSTVMTTNGVGFSNALQDVYKSATNYPGIRAWSASGIAGFDNWSVTAP